MSRKTPARWMTSWPRRAPEQGRERRGGAIEVLFLSLWAGLVAGLLEVGARVSCRAIDPTGRLYGMTRHFIWLTPVVNILVFFGLGILLSAITRLSPRRGRWLSSRILCAMTLLPMLMVAVPQIFPEAWFILTLGIAAWVVPWFERRPKASRRLLVGSFPILSGLVLILTSSVFGGDWLKQRREAGRALPHTDSPNVLFIVLDTVRFDHLSVYGYHRPTTPTLNRLAKRGIRFERARAPASWTLASHASFFTGRWPHELDVRWTTPLITKFPMLAEYMGVHGYATAGFVANFYCSYDTGLDRGFTRHQDYVLEDLVFLRTSVLIEEPIRLLFELDAYIAASPLHPLRKFLRLFYTGIRRDAASINRGFIDWLTRRSEPKRPFFVFLNYMDAHTPYRLPDGAAPRFGREPQTVEERRIIYDNWTSIDKPGLPRHFLTLARDSYDNCLAYLDEQLGSLFDELQRRSLFDRTLVVITSDHGEGLGEHDLFDHGESLYDTEIRVPLLILPPSKSGTEAVVHQTVSLRDLPATVVDLVGLNVGSPFPGQSLANLWRDRAPATGSAIVDEVVSELQKPSPIDPNQGRSPARRGSLISLAKGDFVYIRNEVDGTEELFNERDDPRQLTNRAGVDVFKPILERFRAKLARIKPRALRDAR